MENVSAIRGAFHKMGNVIPVSLQPIKVEIFAILVLTFVCLVYLPPNVILVVKVLT